MSAQFSIPGKSNCNCNWEWWSLCKHDDILRPKASFDVVITISWVWFSLGPVEIINRGAVHPVVPTVTLLLLITTISINNIVMITIINNMIIHRSSTTIKPVEVQSSTQAPSGSLTSCSSPEEKIFTLITDRIGTFYLALLMSVQQTKTSYKVSLPTVTQADKVSSSWCLRKRV